MTYVNVPLSHRIKYGDNDDNHNDNGCNDNGIVHLLDLSK